MPATIGSFHLVRTWTDTLLDGIVVYTWGEYAAPDTAPGTPGPHISLGISPRMGVHDAEVCHIARGEDPIWHGQIDAASPHGTVALTAAAYNDGVTQRLEASTVCDNGACRQYSESGQHVTVVYARPHRGVPLQADTTRPVPVLLKVETTDVLLPPQAAEQQMQSTLSAFLQQADLLQLTAPFSHR
jgi:exosortase J